MENSILRTLKNFSLMERQIPICRTEQGLRALLPLAEENPPAASAVEGRC